MVASYRTETNSQGGTTLNLLTFFLLNLKASLFSTGGTGNVPSLHDDLIERGWADEQIFAESLAVGQVSPGPNGLWAVSLGYLTFGIWGAIAALVAISIPPFTILLVERLYRRVQDHPAVEGFVRGLSLAVVGVFFVVLLRLLHGTGFNVRTVVITLASLGLVATKKVPVFVILAVAAIVGILWRG